MIGKVEHVGKAPDAKCPYCGWEIKTIYGYPAREIAFFAAMANRHGITEEDLHRFCTEAMSGYNAGKDDFIRATKFSIRETLEKVCLDYHFDVPYDGPKEDGDV